MEQCGVDETNKNENVFTFWSNWVTIAHSTAKVGHIRFHAIVWFAYPLSGRHLLWTVHATKIIVLTDKSGLFSMGYYSICVF